MNKELKGVLLIGGANLGFVGALVLASTLFGIPVAIALGWASYKWLMQGIRTMRGQPNHTGRKPTIPPPPPQVKGTP